MDGGDFAGLDEAIGNQHRISVHLATHTTNEEAMLRSWEERSEATGYLVAQ